MDPCFRCRKPQSSPSPTGRCVECCHEMAVERKAEEERWRRMSKTERKAAKEPMPVAY